MIVLHQCLLQPALNRLTSDAPVINLAGRQRMLSQKLAKAALAIAAAGNSTERDARRAELKTTLDEWRFAHQRLRHDSSTPHSDRSQPSAIEVGFQDLEPHFLAMALAADQLLSETSDQPDRAALATLLKHEPQFLTRMHALVGLYEDDARLHVRQLQWLGLIIMSVILLVQVALQLMVVRPAVQIVGREIERSEMQYERLVESMTDGLVVFDPSGCIEFANRRFGTMLGYSADSLVGKPAAIFIADPDRRRFSTMLVEPDMGIEPVDLLLKHADGQLVETMASPQRMCVVQGTPQSLLLVVTDITARKAMEERSRQLLAQLAHADRLKSMGTMAAALAHEINQPLGAIANYAEGCLNRLSGPPIDPAELVEPLEKIRRATHRGAEIIRRTRDFVRLSPHRITYESINNLVHEVEGLCRPEARRRGISMELQLDLDLRVVRVDGIQIQQVLINLIQNAFAAVEDVEPYRRRIKIATGQSAIGVELSVEDTGPGIPPEGAEPWFEPFITTREAGTGMGLAIARSIAEAHGGRIWGEPGCDGGAIFRLTLPLEPPMVPASVKSDEWRVASDEPSTNASSERGGVSPPVLNLAPPDNEQFPSSERGGVSPPAIPRIEPVRSMETVCHG